MKPEEGAWLDQYNAGTRTVHHWLRTLGWAGAKGRVKASIRNGIAFHYVAATSPLYDALLDSVGC